MIINKIIGILAIIIMISSMTTALADVEVTVDSATVANTGDTTTVDIVAHGVIDLSEFCIYFNYDNTTVNVINVTDNSEIPDTLGISDTKDDCSLTLTSSYIGDKPSANGDVVLMTIELKAVGNPCDKSDLILTFGGLEDVQGNPIPVFSTDGIFTIACPGDDDDAADDDAADDDAADDDAADDDAADDDAADDDAADDDAADDDAADDDDTTEIPEFPSLVIPVVAILGLMFLLSRRK